jgi:hypothetical protein
MKFITPDNNAGKGSDDTDALKDMLAHMRWANAPGYLSGTYRVREGELGWYGNDQGITPGPVLYTMPGTKLLALGVADAPILEIASTTPWNYVSGGLLGDLEIIDWTGHEAPNRHGLRLAGVQHMQFGTLKGTSLRGDVVHIQDRTAGDFNGDPVHVFDCRFACIENDRGAGWALNNDAPNQTFNFNDLGVVRAVFSGHGAWRGSGAGNVCRVVDVGGCRGWAVDFRVNHGAPARTIIFAAEFDSPEYGMRVSGNLLLKLWGARFNHRYREQPGSEADDKAWPKVAIQLGEHEADRKANPALASLAMNIQMEVTHRLGPHTNPLTPETMGVLLDLSNDDGVCDITVKTQIIDAHTPRLPIVTAVNLSPNAWGVHVLRDDMTVIDTRRKSLV